MYLFIIARGLNSLVATHVVISTTSIILYGAFKGSLSDEIMEGESFSHDGPCASWVTSQLDELVKNMYSGKGIPRTNCLPRKKDGPIHFDPNATFADPAVICLGHDEIMEAFRALKFTNRQHIAPPRLLELIPRKNHKNSWSATYALDQRYGGLLSVRSLLVIHLDVMDETTKNTGDRTTNQANHNAILIKNMEERWNGVGLLGNIFWYSRRLNGTMSYALISLLVN